MARYYAEITGFGWPEGVAAMRIWMILAVICFSTAACAQTGGDIAGSGPLSPVADLGFAEIPQTPRPDRSINKPTNDALDKLVERVSLDKIPLSQAFEGVARDAHLIMSIEWKKLEDAGVSRDTPVTIELRQIPARKVLGLILASVSAVTDVRFVVDNNRVVISTKEDLQSGEHLAVIVYDLRAFFADLELDSPQAAQLAAGIIETVESTIDDNSWRDNGGTVGSAKIINGQLIVYQTMENQDEVARFLREAFAGTPRATRAYDVRDLVKGDASSTMRTPQETTKVQSLIAAIQANCGRDTWRDRGGKTSSIAYFDGKLYITTKLAVHDQIEHLLALMRK
jgi:hypothetical protein